MDVVGCRTCASAMGWLMEVRVRGVMKLKLDHQLKGRVTKSIEGRYVWFFLSLRIEFVILILMNK